MVEHDEKRLPYAWLQENVISLLTVGVGAVTFIGTRIGLVDANQIPGVSLGLLVLLATSQIVEKNRKLEKLQASLDEGVRSIAGQIGVADVERLGPSAEAHAYMARAVGEAKTGITHVALGSGYARPRSPEKEAFYKALEKVIGAAKVQYTYVTAFYDRRRWERVRNWLQKPKAGKVYVGHYRTEAAGSVLAIASLYLLIIDSREVIVRLPKEVGQTEEYLRIRNAKLVELFRDYASLLWKNSEKISERNYDAKKMEEIGRKLALTAETAEGDGPASLSADRK